MRDTIFGYRDLCDSSPIFRGRERFAKWFIKFTSVDKLNKLYANNCSLSGVDFASGVLDELGITLSIENAQRLDSLPKGGFVTVSNHPLGGLDGVSLIKVMGENCAGFKVMANMVLNHIEAMRECFVEVDPFSSDNAHKRRASMRGIREVINAVGEGHPVGFFPAGAVSKVGMTLAVRDREWQAGVIRLIRMLGVPVVPIRFDDTNSVWFKLLGMVSWRLRSLLLPSEVFRKSGSTIRMAIGETITTDDIAVIVSDRALGKFLKTKTYSI